jgi:hypothetical protein
MIHDARQNWSVSLRSVPSCMSSAYALRKKTQRLVSNQSVVSINQNGKMTIWIVHKLLPDTRSKRRCPARVTICRFYTMPCPMETKRVKESNPPVSEKMGVKPNGLPIGHKRTSQYVRLWISAHVPCKGRPRLAQVKSGEPKLNCKHQSSLLVALGLSRRNQRMLQPCDVFSLQNDRF